MSPFFHESILLNDKAIFSSWDLHYAVIVKNCYELVSLPPVLFSAGFHRELDMTSLKLKQIKAYGTLILPLLITTQAFNCADFSLFQGV